MASKAYAIADLHLGHGEKITQFRPFASAAEHDQFVVDKINARVNPRDTLFLLGDIVIREEGWEYLKQIKCQRLVLVPGNHCGERTPIRPEFFSRISGAESRQLPISRRTVVMTHIPIHPSCLDRWAINIHGHLHADSIDDPRYVCVSCEAVNYTPIDMESIHWQLRARDWIADEQKEVV